MPNNVDLDPLSKGTVPDEVGYFCIARASEPTVTAVTQEKYRKWK